MLMLRVHDHDHDHLMDLESPLESPGWSTQLLLGHLFFKMRLEFPPDVCLVR